ncbi:MAG: hypothetical protein IPK67_02685 [Planctomycetes bacterium]|nr:hypothetical protein [Planctomycetota bacterium]
MSFETSDSHGSPAHRPVRVAALLPGVFEEAKSLAGDLPGWRVVSSDGAAGQIQCLVAGGLLGGSAKVTITLEAPPGIPSTTVRVRSESSGGLFSRDRAIVAAFVRPFHRRVCL